MYSYLNFSMYSYLISKKSSLMIVTLFKEIDSMKKAGYTRAVYFYTKKILVTLCATEGFEKTLDLSLLFEAFSW